MFAIHNLFLFVVSCALLNITPGQDTMYIVGRSVAQGKKAGILSVLGIMSGVLIHTLLAALGLSVILAASAWAFNIVKYMGAAYLVWIGIAFWRGAGHRETLETGSMRPLFSPWKIYAQGVFTNLLNPKVALFFLSFLPQFVDPRADNVFVSFMTLGLIFFTTGSIWCTFLVLASAWLTDRFRSRAAIGGVLKKLTGALFVGLGIKLALSDAG